ncbi:MAG: SulP family inorganic anion transporter, partial [Pseudomonadota bacterium]
MKALSRFFPFLRWFPLTGDVIKADFMAGLTVALVLIPQSMAYAQLAGLPAYYGLYAAFLPVAVASLWGSSNQLGTGPVAVVSLLTASSLAVLAAPGSEDFIALAIMLAFLVGLVQLTLGVFKLGVVVNFLSHPVIVGFTNAAAIIIGLSQVSKLFGVPMGRSESFMADIWGVLQQIGDTHLPTLAMGIGAIAIMWAIRKYKPQWPGVLIAVVITTTISWAIGFENNLKGHLEQVADADLKAMVKHVADTDHQLKVLNQEIADKTTALLAAEKEEGKHSQNVVAQEADLTLSRMTASTIEAELNALKARLRHIQVVRAVDAAGETVGLYVAGKAPAGVKLDGYTYRIRKVDGDKFRLV